jgi:hypothetical protein
MFSGKFLNALFDSLNDLVRRGSSRSDADRVGALQPFRAQILRRLHVMNAYAIPTARFHQFPRVIAVRAANDNDHVTFLRHFHRCVLALFRRLANGINETNLGLGKAPS